jgi:hypothetical protein
VLPAVSLPKMTSWPGDPAVTTSRLSDASYAGAAG